jgi:AhpD family alkylhydroperoxidase
LAWSVGDHELMAGLVSGVNACEFCIKVHTAVAVRAYGDEPKVAAVLADLETAPISEPLTALRMLGKLTRANVGADDMHSLLAAGVLAQQIEDALAVCFAFNIINRLTETFAFSVPVAKAFETGGEVPARTRLSLRSEWEDSTRSLATARFLGIRGPASCREAGMTLDRLQHRGFELGLEI